VLVYFLAAQQKQIQFISSKLEPQVSLDRAKLVTLDEKCAQQALRTFNEEKVNFQGGGTYTNHYNRNLNKCFVYIELRGVFYGEPQSEKLLEDAYEHKIYAIYWWQKSLPITCRLNPDGDESKQHEISEAQFNDFVREYMND
jgi:hypothetical protein